MKKNRPRISVEELREIAAEHLLKNKEQFAAFLESDIGNGGIFYKSEMIYI